MRKKHKFADALNVLNSRSSSFGADLIVDSPIRVVQQHLQMSYQTTLGYLKELEGRNAIVLERDPRDARLISRARILLRELPARLHEKSDHERLLASMRKYKTRSSNGASWIVHSGFFPKIHGDADITLHQMYNLLKNFETRGFIEIVRDQFTMREKILFVTLLDAFPAS